MNRGKIIPRLARPNLAIFRYYWAGWSLRTFSEFHSRPGCRSWQATCPVFVDPGLFSDHPRSTTCPGRFLACQPGRAEQAGRPGPRGRWGGDGDLPRGGGAGSRRQWLTCRSGGQVELTRHVQAPVKGRRGLTDEQSGPQPPRVWTPRTRARRPSRRLEMTATGAMRAPSPAGAARSV